MSAIYYSGIYLSVAYMVLCFKFVTKAVWKTQGCFILLLTKAGGVFECFLILTLSHQESRLGMHKELVGDTAGTAPWISPQLIQGISTTWCPHKAGVGRRKREMLGVTVISVHNEAELSWRWQNTCLPMRSSE